MSKKYYPSGYQIINIDTPDNDYIELVGSDGSIKPDRESKPDLYELACWVKKAINGEIVKPLLLRITTANFTAMIAPQMYYLSSGNLFEVQDVGAEIAIRVFDDGGTYVLEAVEL